MRLPDPILLHAIGHVRSPRTLAVDDAWGAVRSCIVLDGAVLAPDALRGLEGFSHLEVLFHMHRVAPDEIERGARRPRDRADLPEVGILAQRAKGRPNCLGLSRCRLLAIEGLNLHVEGLDAIDETPVLDVKPWIQEMGPRGAPHQPAWVALLMDAYYAR